MSRPGLFRHRKFIRLARLLGSDALAAGHLEILWHAAYEAGDANLGTSADLEYLGRWQGEPGKLCSALLEAGFIDASGQDETFVVHDLFDHAPDYVRQRWVREQQRKKSGKTMSDVRSEAAKSRWQKQSSDNADMQTDANENHLHTGQYANVATPSPSPSPSPSPAPAPAHKRERARSFVKPSREDVQALFTAQKLAGDPAEFFDYYESNGWRVGQSSMKDWPATARNWSRRQPQFNSNGSSNGHAKQRVLATGAGQVYDSTAVGNWK